jgi:hypothetical protein
MQNQIQLSNDYHSLVAAFVENFGYSHPLAVQEALRFEHLTAHPEDNNLRKLAVKAGILPAIGAAIGA